MNQQLRWNRPAPQKLKKTTKKPLKLTHNKTTPKGIGFIVKKGKKKSWGPDGWTNANKHLKTDNSNSPWSFPGVWVKVP